MSIFLDVSLGYHQFTYGREQLLQVIQVQNHENLEFLKQTGMAARRK